MLRKRIWSLISKSFEIWMQANAQRMAASLAFYAMLSLAPILTLAIAIANFFFERQLAEQEVIELVSEYSTPQVAETVANLVQNTNTPNSGLIAGAISLTILVFAASGVFSQLSYTFNDIWRIPEQKKRSVEYLLKQRFVGIVLVLTVGLLLILTLVQSATLEFVSEWFAEYNTRAEPIIRFAERAVSYLVMPVLFALLFRYIPAIRVRFGDVWLAGMLTAILFAGGRYLIQLYLRFSTTSEVYGASGSLVILLIWIYVTGLLVFYGAAFSHAWTFSFGSQRERLIEYLDDPDRVLASMRRDSVKPNETDV